MACILFTWELGGGLGHLAHLLPLALELRRRGHRIEFALKDLTHADTILGQYGFAAIQAPIRLNYGEASAASASYAEILINAGFLRVNEQLSFVKAWRHIFALTQADLLIADHSPTALLAARGLPLLKAQIGSGFFYPPQCTPMPAFRIWEKIDPQRIAAGELQVVDHINSVLSQLQAPRLSALTDLFDLDANFLCSWKELDHYGEREGLDYRGPILMLDEGEPPSWPLTGKARVFAYLKASYPHLDRVMQMLRDSSCSTVVYLQGGNESMFARYASENVACTAKLVNMRAALETADLILCHAGMSTTSAALLAGKPLLLFPANAEQYLVTLRTEKLGAGIGIVPEIKEIDFLAVLEYLLREPLFVERAKSFAARYNQHDIVPQFASIADQCESLLASMRL